MARKKDTQADADTPVENDFYVRIDKPVAGYVVGKTYNVGRSLGHHFTEVVKVAQEVSAPKPKDVADARQKGSTE